VTGTARGTVPGTAHDGAPGHACGDTLDVVAQRRRVERALRRSVAPFPYLAGLAAQASVDLDARVPTMGVFESGRMVANPAFVARLDEADLLFVVAHELLHLALRTHRRALGADRMQFNVAHDYIINDLLRDALGTTRIPAGGLDMPGARLRSAEEVLLEMRRQARARGDGDDAPRRMWRMGDPGDAGAGGERPGDGGEDGDVLAEATEREWFGGDRATQRERARAIEEAARRGVAIARATGALSGSLLARMGLLPGGSGGDVDAERGAWRVPPGLALQRWIESVAAGARSFERAPRRASPDPDVVLPGRRREGALLVVVLDTSGSMVDSLGRALGALADACDALGIDRVRLVQCDAAVTGDELVEPADLARRRLDGWGGSDMGPALHHLAADPTVRAVVVLTDGEVCVPDERWPYELAWLLPPGASPSFSPSQGRVIRLSEQETSS
jgi:predicted metal-dependent peptidase